MMITLVCKVCLLHNTGKVGNVKKAFKRACVRAGVPEVSRYTLRHTFGTLPTQEGIDIMKIKEAMAHKHIATTAGYLKMQTSKIMPVVEVMERAVNYANSTQVKDLRKTKPPISS